MPEPLRNYEDQPAQAAIVAASADIDARTHIGPGAQIWHLAQLRENVRIGAGCIIGRGAYLGPGVVLGKNCKVQNSALIYEPAVLEDGVFVGPAVVFTNDEFPRAINPDGSRKGADDWSVVGVVVREGASIGARAVCIAPLEIGAWALVAAGAVVTRDVPAFAIVAGVPARRVGWVGRAGVPLIERADGCWQCPASAELYRERGGTLEAVEE